MRRLIVIILFIFAAPCLHAQDLSVLYKTSCRDGSGWNTPVLISLGDVNGDKASDFAVGLPKESAVAVFSGASGNLIYKKVGDSGTMFGASISAMADRNGDGIKEILVGAPKLRSDAFIISGADGSVLTKIPFLSCANFDCKFGGAVAAVDDIDGDGIEDFAISDYGHAFSSSHPPTGVIIYKSGKTLERIIEDYPYGQFSSFGGYTLASVGPYVAEIMLDGYLNSFIRLFNPKNGNLPGFIDAADENGWVVRTLGDLTGDGIKEFFNKVEKGFKVYDGSNAAAMFTSYDPLAQFADENGDGKPEIITGQYVSPSAIEINAYDYQSFAGIKHVTLTEINNDLSSNFNIFGVDDVNRDGKSEAVIWSGTNCYLISSGTLLASVGDKQNPDGNVNFSTYKPKQPKVLIKSGKVTITFEAPQKKGSVRAIIKGKKYTKTINSKKKSASLSNIKKGNYSVSYILINETGERSASSKVKSFSIK